MKGLVRRLAARSGYEIFRRGTHARQAQRYADVVRQLTAVASEPPIELPPTPGRDRLLASLIGTDPVQALHLIKHLHRSLSVAGDICEFGVAQGATSALMANELLHHAPRRQLWLYDSFEGLPSPGERDRLLDDPLDLGSIEAYAGRMAEPRSAVENRLRAVPWPRRQTRIIEGYFTAATAVTDMPQQVAFAYIDFDFYQPILDALSALGTRLPVGGSVVVDDYGFLSSGAQDAVDEFCASHPDQWAFSKGPSYCQPLAILTRTA